MSVRARSDWLAAWEGNAGLTVLLCAVLAVTVQIRLVRWGSPHLALYGWILCLLLGWMAVDNVRNAFVDYPDVTRQVAMGPTYVGNFLRDAPGAGHTVMLSDGSYFLTYEPIQFLAPKAKGCTLLPNVAPKSCPIWNTSRLFVLLPGRVKDLPALERSHPGGRVVSIATYSYGTAHILAYELPQKSAS